MKWWQTGYWSLWRNETALHSPQSELDQGFLELQIVNDKSCATKNLWREGGSAVVLASMLYNWWHRQPLWQWVYYAAAFIFWANCHHLVTKPKPILRIFVKKKAPKLPDFEEFLFNHHIQIIGSNKLSKYSQILNCFLLSSLTCSQIWLIPLCGWSPVWLLITKLGARKKRKRKKDPV
jgi:hypothetical protein